ncbi:uncharacterized protein LOC102803603 isoform X1 [Saccoglossus kowalevskii]|uniref:Uncharacterized protein LOC102803603 n=1 Tax=Saccoglossus kowalevskii TaxID=10224 RepID=A0ABM0M4B9_SACKO|nr:PREDICTED: uncharacterized protein LOC102803603 [Saccoglossus kowalevskii]
MNHRDRVLSWKKSHQRNKHIQNRTFRATNLMLSEGSQTLNLLEKSVKLKMEAISRREISPNSDLSRTMRKVNNYQHGFTGNADVVHLDGDYSITESLYPF